MPLGLAALGLLAACAAEGAFACEHSVECEAPGVVGRCVAGYCGFLDPGCASGLRYGAHAPAELALSCAPWDRPADDGDGIADDTGNATKGPLATGGGEPEGSTTSDDSATTDGFDSSSFVDAPPVCALELVDEFDTDDLVLRWGLSSEISFQVTSGGGALELRTSADTPGSAWIEAPLGPFVERVVEVTSLVEPDVPYAYAWFEVRADVVYRFAIETGVLRIVVDAEAPAPQQIELAHDPHAHRWLRIDASGGRVRYQASPDGEAWVELHSAPAQDDAPASTVAIGLTAWAATSSDPRITLDRVASCTWMP